MYDLVNFKGILGQIKSGNGFVNPIRSGVTSALQDLTIPSLSTLTTMANAQALAMGVSAPNSTQLNTANASITNAYNKVQELLGHTDRISGVNLTGDGTLSTIAKTMQTAKNLNGDLSCSTVLGAFGSIQKSAELVIDSVNTITAIKTFLNNIPGQIASIPSIVDAYTNKVTQQIANDVAVLSQAKLEIIQHNLSQRLNDLVEDECMSQVMGSVLTQPMKNEVANVAKQLKTVRFPKLFT